MRRSTPEGSRNRLDGDHTGTDDGEHGFRRLADERRKDPQPVDHGLAGSCSLLEPGGDLRDCLDPGTVQGSVPTGGERHRCGEGCCGRRRHRMPVGDRRRQGSLVGGPSRVTGPHQAEGRTPGRAGGARRSGHGRLPPGSACHQGRPGVVHGTSPGGNVGAEDARGQPGWVVHRVGQDAVGRDEGELGVGARGRSRHYVAADLSAPLGYPTAGTILDRFAEGVANGESHQGTTPPVLCRRVPHGVAGRRSTDPGGYGCGCVGAEPDFDVLWCLHAQLLSTRFLLYSL